jgi:N-acetylglucosamine-6-phosphate deacetylase
VSYIHQRFHCVYPIYSRALTIINNITGVHLEGPFLNKEKKGAHRLENIRDRMSKEEVMDVYGESLDNACIITLAPELEGCLETLPWLREQGVVISLGHSMANLQKAKEAINKGATLITHLFNAMLPFHHRDPGIVGLLTSLDLPRDIYYSMISDGHHTDMTVQRIAYNANPNGVVLITDGIKAMGLSPGHYNLGDMIIDVANNISYLAGTQTLAGSVATLDECIRCFIQATDCSLASALEAASLHPAKVLEGIGYQIGYPADGKPSRGHLGVGAPADVTFLTPLSDKTSPLRVVATVIAGDIVYKATDCTMYEIL